MYDMIWKDSDPMGMGESIMLLGRLLQRIVDLAHYEKLKSPSVILFQTEWGDLYSLVDYLFEVILHTHPDVPPTLLFTWMP